MEHYDCNTSTTMHEDKDEIINLNKNVQKKFSSLVVEGENNFVAQVEEKDASNVQDSFLYNILGIR